MNIAVIDMGTNSTRLLIAESGPYGAFREIVRSTDITGLGKDVGADKRLTKAGIARTAAVLRRYAGAIGDNEVDMVRVAATAAMRDAANADEVVGLVEDILGIRPKIISGEMEAALTFLGVLSDPFIAHMGTDFMVIDIGGGSTEISRGRDKPQISKSLPLGAVRVREAFFQTDPPTAADLAAAREHVRALLAAEFEPTADARTVAIAVAGTATALAAIELEMEPYDPRQTHRFRLTAECVNRLFDELAVLPLAERERVVGLEPRRADIIVSGTVILAAIMDFFGFESVLVSERDILDGLAISAAADYRERN